MDQHDNLFKMRHSCEHVLMEAMEKLYPGLQKAMGPATKDGFYFDFDMPDGQAVSSDDFPRIERIMQEIIAQNKPFVREEVSVSTARELLKDNLYKQEWLNEIEQRGEKVTLYWTGDDKDNTFVDLCRGPHLVSTGEIKAFKILSVAGAYWRGDSNNKMLTRIYGTAFETQAELDQFLYQREEAKKRDHRKLGKELGLFTFAPDLIGQGLPLWLPKGTVIRDELEAWAKQIEHEHGYERVVTPVLGKEELYLCSGHLPYYKEDMYEPIQMEEERYYLRPMNCPHHHHIYKAEPRSYRDLPLRVAEYGNVFRYEASGSLSGLMRTRDFCQNDAHIYCRADQVEDEFANVLELYRYYYDILGITDYWMRLSKPDFSKGDKYVGEADKWEAMQNVARSAMDKVSFPYIEVDGEAAFYGPKIDVQIKSAIGTEYTISTNQLDFLATERFDLNYVGDDGHDHGVYVIHRSPLGSHERFIAYLIEHYAGAFPVWLAPVQIKLIPVSDKHRDACQILVKRLRSVGLRAELDSRSETMNARIREAHAQKIPYAVIIGDKEIEQQTVSVRDRNNERRDGFDLNAFIDTVLVIKNSKSLKLWD